MKQIEELLDKYFEGLTSRAEEQEMRSYFARNTDEIPEHLAVYRPLFIYINTEIQKGNEQKERISRVYPFRKKTHILFRLAIACAILSFVFITYQLMESNKNLPDNYVMIDGKLYTDIATIRAQISHSLDNVIDDPGELIFSENDDD